MLAPVPLGILKIILQFLTLDLSVLLSKSFILCKSAFFFFHLLVFLHVFYRMLYYNRLTLSNFEIIQTHVCKRWPVAKSNGYLPFKNTASDLCTASRNSGSQYPHHSNRMMTPEQYNFSFGSILCKQRLRKVLITAITSDCRIQVLFINLFYMVMGGHNLFSCNQYCKMMQNIS